MGNQYPAKLICRGLETFTRNDLAKWPILEKRSAGANFWTPDELKKCESVAWADGSLHVLLASQSIQLIGALVYKQFGSFIGVLRVIEHVAFAEYKIRQFLLEQLLGHTADPQIVMILCQADPLIDWLLRHDCEYWRGKELFCRRRTPDTGFPMVCHYEKHASQAVDHQHHAIIVGHQSINHENRDAVFDGLFK